MMSRQRKGKENEAVHGVGTFGKIVSYVVMILVCFISLFPVIWVAISSLKADPLQSRDLLCQVHFVLMDISEYSGTCIL